MNYPISLAVLLGAFLCAASPHTISSYRHTFTQFLKFTKQPLQQARPDWAFSKLMLRKAKIVRPGKLYS